jgi:intermediate filament protein if
LTFFFNYLDEADLAALRSQSVSNDLDPSQFFRNELSEAIREIRNDYETTVESQRNDLQNRHFLLINEILIRTQQPENNPLFNEQQRRQVQRTRDDLVQTRNQNSHLQAKNQEMQQNIENLQQSIKDLQDRGQQFEDIKIKIF